MENLRNIISNLYIYKGTLNRNKSSLNQIDEEPILPQNAEASSKLIYPSNANNLPKEKKIETNKDTTKIIKGISINKPRELNKEKKRNNQNEFYNKNYILHKNSFLIKPETNFILKNKELIREKEHEMRELKLKQENDALNLLLSQKMRKNGGVRSKIFDYESQHEKNRKRLIKKGKFKIRSHSSQNAIKDKNIRIKSYQEQNEENIYNIGNNVILPKCNNTYGDNGISSYNDKNEQNIDNYNSNVINEEESPFKYYKSYAETIKLPNINNLQNSYKNPLLENVPILHKDYGRTPAYLEKRKEEIKLQKEEDKFKEKEKKLPKGSRILRDEERKERLKELLIIKKGLEDELFKLPIARLSKRQRERKGEIEKSLDEIEEKINKFNGYKDVIVKI